MSKSVDRQIAEQTKDKSKAEMQLEEIKNAVLAYDKHPYHIYAWSDFMLKLHKTLGLKYDTGE
jgi:hypothetical protein